MAPTPVASPDSATPAVPTAATASSDTARVTHRYYTARDYGTDAEFNPVSLVLNGGFDQLRTGEYRNVRGLPYGSSLHTILESIAHPDGVLRQYGYERWLRNEMFPLTTKGEGGGQWVPNYQLHLFAGGMTYVRMVEWYEQHGVTGHPELAAGVSVYAWHVLTEIVENGAHRGYDEDGFTDLLFFDSGSIMLWNQEWVKRLFSTRGVEFTDWPGQPALSFPGTTVENANMLAMLRAPIPGTSNWKAMTTMGTAFLIGASRRMGRGYWLSAGAGFDPVDNPVIDTLTNAKSVAVAGNVAAFLDRNGALLASLIVKGGSTNGPTLNVYPGVVGIGPVSPGFWIQEARAGTLHGSGLRVGICSRWGVGLGAARYRPIQ